jgi:hypothetical protein
MKPARKTHNIRCDALVTEERLNVFGEMEHVSHACSRPALFVDRITGEWRCTEHQSAGCAVRCELLELCLTYGARCNGSYEPRDPDDPAECPRYQAAYTRGMPALASDTNVIDERLARLLRSAIRDILTLPDTAP